MSVTIKVTEKTRRILIDVTKLEGTTKKGLEAALFEIGKDVQRETIKLIKTGEKTGKVYRFRGRDHTASAPFEAPANRSGRLARSIRYNVTNWQKMTVGAEAPYAGYLEKGTPDMEERPFLEKAVHNRQQDTVNSILENVKRATEQGSTGGITRQRGMAGL
jgi:HK97 gp10 family phage protein